MNKRAQKQINKSKSFTKHPLNKKHKYLKKKEKIEMTEKILPQDQKEKSEHRESSRLRSQPRKNYKTFIPQSKILKKVEFKNNFHFYFPSSSFTYFDNTHFQNNMLKNNRTNLVQNQPIEIIPNKTLYL